MRKMIAILISLVCVVSVFASDANLMKYVEILPAQASTLEATDLLLLGPVSNVDAGSTAGSAINVSAYEGYALVVCGLSARVEANDTSTVAVVYGFTGSPATALVTFTQTTATAKFESYEFDFDTLQGTNAALYLKATSSNVEGHATTGTCGSAVLIYNAARSDQTITGTGIDVSDYKGNAAFMVHCGGAVNEAAAYTNTVTIQHSATLNGTYTTLTNLAGTAGTKALVGVTGSVQTFPCDLGRANVYVRATSVQQNDAGSVGVTMVAPMKSD